MALVRLGGADVISASPERFLSRRGDRIETRPIKGTRPRAAEPADDRRQALALRSSAKDRAENVMIVDLARNDLGRVARYGTVAVAELCALESHPGRAPPRVERRGPPAARRLGRGDRARHVPARLGHGRAQDPRARDHRGARAGAARALLRRDRLVRARAGTSSCRSRSAPSWPPRGRLHLHVGGAVMADSDPAVEWQRDDAQGGAPAGRRRGVGAGARAARARFLKVWLNGALVDEGAARVSAFDHGFLVGDGVFETLRGLRGRPFALDEHLARLRASAEVMRIPVPRRSRSCGARRCCGRTG